MLHVATAVKNAKAGQARYRTDKAGIVHSSIGKISFTAEDISGELHPTGLSPVSQLPPIYVGCYF
jgi:large subunit ribosomal protein L1